MWYPDISGSDTTMLDRITEASPKKMQPPAGLLTAAGVVKNY